MPSSTPFLRARDDRRLAFGHRLAERLVLLQALALGHGIDHGAIGLLRAPEHQPLDHALVALDLGRRLRCRSARGCSDRRRRRRRSAAAPPRRSTAPRRSIDRRRWRAPVAVAGVERRLRLLGGVPSCGRGAPGLGRPQVDSPAAGSAAHGPPSWNSSGECLVMPRACRTPSPQPAEREQRTDRHEHSSTSWTA